MSRLGEQLGDPGGSKSVGSGARAVLPLEVLMVMRLDHLETFLAAHSRIRRRKAAPVLKHRDGGQSLVSCTLMLLCAEADATRPAPFLNTGEQL